MILPFYLQYLLFVSLLLTFLGIPRALAFLLRTFRIA
jgi:hypothetical protein